MFDTKIGRDLGNLVKRAPSGCANTLQLVEATPQRWSFFLDCGQLCIYGCCWSKVWENGLVTGESRLMTCLLPWELYEKQQINAWKCTFRRLPNAGSLKRALDSNDPRTRPRHASAPSLAPARRPCTLTTTTFLQVGLLTLRLRAGPSVFPRQWQGSRSHTGISRPSSCSWADFSHSFSHCTLPILRLLVYAPRSRTYSQHDSGASAPQNNGPADSGHAVRHLARPKRTSQAFKTSSSLRASRAVPAIASTNGISPQTMTSGTASRRSRRIAGPHHQAVMLENLTGKPSCRIWLNRVVGS